MEGFTVGHTVKHEGDVFTVLEIKQETWVDFWGAPPVDTHHISLEDTITGEVVDIKIDD